MKRIGWKFLSGLAACSLLAATTLSAKVPVPKPWKAHGVTTLVLDLTNYLETGDPVCGFWAQGTGEATHFGRYTSGGVHTFNLETGEITGECWIQAASQGPDHQQQLFFRPTPISADAFFYEITHGTGRFQDVTGWFIENTITLSEETVVVEEPAGQFRV